MNRTNYVSPQEALDLRHKDVPIETLRDFFTRRDAHYKRTGPVGDYLILSPMPWPKKWLNRRDMEN